MNTRIHFPGWGAVAACAALVAPAIAQVPAPQAAQKPVFRDAATSDQLAMKLRKAEQEDPMRNLKTLKESKGEDPSVKTRPPSLLENSDIICFQGDAVLVPKRAILQAPASLADRMKLQPGAKFRRWIDFYAANRGWITTIEVSRTQAEGNDEIPEESRNQMARMAKMGNLIVATYKSSPISVLPPKVPAAGTPAAAPANGAAPATGSSTNISTPIRKP